MGEFLAAAKRNLHIVAFLAGLGVLGALSAGLDVADHLRPMIHDLGMSEAAKAALRQARPPVSPAEAASAWAPPLVLFLAILAGACVPFVAWDIVLQYRRDRSLVAAQAAAARSERDLAEARDQATGQEALAKTASERAIRLESTLRQLTLAASMICNRLYRTNARLQFKLVSMEERFDVYEDGGTDYHRAAVVEGSDAATHFWTIWHEADASAPPIEGLADLGLSVRSEEAGTDAVVLPTDSQPHRQDYAIFFLPEIAKGERRTIHEQFRWPGFWNDLTGPRGATRLYASLRGRTDADVTDFRIVMRFQGALAGRVAVRVISQPKPGATLTLSRTLTANDTWTYHDPQMRLDGGKLQIEVARL